MGKTMIVVNPVAANGRTGARWSQIRQHLQAQGLEFSEQLTGAPDDATRITREALQQGYTTIVAVGGDGTLNETLNGFFIDDTFINPNARFGILSCGTGGDFIRTAGIPRDYKEAAAVLIAGKERLIDIGKVTFTAHSGERVSRYFLNVAGFGVDGEIVYRVNHTSKALGGFLSFLSGTILGLLSYHSVPVTLEIDDKICHEGPATVVAVSNGQYFGSGMQVAPLASLDSGYFSIVMADGMSRLQTLTLLPLIYSGKHLQDPRVRVYSGRRVKAVSTGKMLLDIDGEQPGKLDAEFSILPACLPVIL